MDNQQRLDLLSDLPWSIIHIILCLIPSKQAVRTSVLSKQWMFAWTALPSLKFNDDDGLGYRSYSEFEESENKVISNALHRHEGPILRFEMSFSRKIEFPKLNEWILCLSSKGIRELDITSDYFNYKFDKLQSIYECSKLTHLKLSYATFCPPPSTFKGFPFPFLRCLSLQYCELSDEAQSLLVSCPLLERLTLDHCYGGSELRINLSYLKYLCLKGFWEEIHLCAPLLTELHAEMDACDWLSYKPPHYHLCNYTDLEKICGDEFLIKILRTGMESTSCRLVFSRLKEIELGYVDFEDIKEISVVARLLNGAPNLQKLRLSCKVAREMGDEPEAPDVSIEDFGCAPNFKFQKLRLVTLFRICNYLSEMQLVKFLLESSPVLETMNIETVNEDDYEDVKAELLAFRRASPNAQIFLNRSRLVVD